MTKYKALFLDIDGTILKPDHTYDFSTKDAILQVQELGIEVFLSTGRPIHEITDLAEELNIHSFIGYNGAFAIYKEQSIVDEPMSVETVREFVNIAQKHGHEIVLYTSEKNYFTNLDAPSAQNFIEMFQMKNNDQYHDGVANQVLSATLLNLEGDELRLYEGDPSYHFAQVNINGLRNCYDVIRDTVNKGAAIQKVLEHINVLKEATIAFGDGMNDKEMLSTVGEGFVMGNGHPDLFAYGNRKTSAVTESGIFNGLQSIGLVE
ncbi:HAD family hydrolase [Bacillus sp. N9]